MNHYANKKSAAESMLDIALLMANASQLKAVVEQGPSFAFYVPLVVLISISLTLQIGVGVLLIFLGRSLGGAAGPPACLAGICSHPLGQVPTTLHTWLSRSCRVRGPHHPDMQSRKWYPTPAPMASTLVFVSFCFVF